MRRRQPILSGHTRFCLLDANLLAGYYLPECLHSQKARDRVRVIIEAVRKRTCPELFFYIPNFCIAEVFRVFAKYRWAKWDSAVKRNLPNGLDKQRYHKICGRFHNDIHNGFLLQQVELNRYHVLATDLISPVDAYYEYNRHRPGGRRYRKQMMSAADQLLIGMGIHLAKIHSRSNFAILTADHRLANILNRAKSVRQRTAERLELVGKAKALGLKYDANIYPQVFHLGKAKNAELAEFFGEWPLPTHPCGTGRSGRLTETDARLLVRLHHQLGVSRDSLPYSREFDSILADFKRQTGKDVSAHEAWRAICRVEKRPKRR